MVARKGYPIEQLGSVPKQLKIVWLKDEDPGLQELHQGIGCQVMAPNWGDYQTFIEGRLQQKKDPLILVLDQVEDPNNLGQIIRTSEGAGVDAILLPGRRSAHLTQAAAQTSQGAFAWVPVFNAGNLRQALDYLKEKGFWLYACENHEQARPWYQVDLKGPVTIVLGSEGSGVRSLTLKTCDDTVFLPMSGRINSLNVSATAAAILFEAIRQRHISQD